MNKFIIQTFFILLICSNAVAQSLGLDTLAKLPVELKEVSALIKSKNGNLWTLNDSGNQPIIFQIDLNGKILHQTFIANANNVDWEELTIDAKGNLYIGDFGNNRNDRKDLKIYIVNEQVLLAQDTAIAEVITFSYPDQRNYPEIAAHRNFDMEAMVYYNKKLVLFSKNRTEPFSGYSYVYYLPATPGEYVAEKVDSIYLGEGPRELYQVTAADLSPDGKNLILLSYDKFFIVFDFPYNDLIGGRVVRKDFKELSQKESIAWVTDSTALIADEKSILGGGYLYSVDMASVLKENNEARKKEVSLPFKEFRDTLFVDFTTDVRGKVYYEFYSGEGDRVYFETAGYFERGSHSFKIVPSQFMNGAYMLNVQIGTRPHAFFVYRYNKVDWEKVKDEFEKRMKELQKR